MSERPPSAADPQPVSLGPASADDRRLLLETLTVIALAVLPDLANAVFALSTAAAEPPFAHGALWILVRSLQVVAPVLYMAWRSGEPWSRFGLGPFRAGPDIALGIALFAASWVLHWAYWVVVFSFQAGIDLHETLTPAMSFDAPSEAVEWLLLAAMSAANGFAEEFVIFGFLMTRLSALLRNRVKAAVAAAALFASYHIYQGPLLAGDIFLFGLLHAAAFLAVGRIWPLVIAHAIADFVAYASYAAY